jgi:heptosyltransferase-2
VVNTSSLRILVIAPSWVGDALLSQPLLTLLKNRDPQSRIDVLAPGWALPIFRRMPEVSAAFESPFTHGDLALGGRLRLGRRLRGNGYDRAYVLPNSFKSALVPLFARIPARVGFVGELRQWLLTDSRRLDAQALPLMVQRFAHLAGGKDAPVPNPLPRPRLQVMPAERDELRRRLELGTARRIACFCPGAEYGPAKRWPPEHFGALASRLAAAGYAVWVVGSAKESGIGEAVRARSNQVAVNLCGRTTLDEAVVLLSCADMIVSNDSGLMHVAAALDRPLAALFGSSSPRYTPPMSAQARIIALGLDCSPCFERECPLGHLRCLNELSPDRVAAAAPHSS